MKSNSMDQKGEALFRCLAFQSYPSKVFMKFFCILLSGCMCLLSLQSEEKELYFTSKENIPQKMIEKIRKEKKSIRLVASRLSQIEIIQALMEAHQRNVSIEVIVDSVSITPKSPLFILEKEGIEVFVWQKNGDSSRLYQNFCVFGSEYSWTGTYNFCLKPKAQHFENALYLQSKEISQRFLEEFDEIKKRHTIPFTQFILKKNRS